MKSGRWRWRQHAQAADSAAIELEVQAGQGGALRAHPLDIAIIVDNLLDNAIKYAGRGARV